MAHHTEYGSGHWRRVARPNEPHPLFSRAHVQLGAIHAAGILVGMLAADQMKSASARWSAIAAFGIATGIGEAIWRNRINQERGEPPEKS